MHEYNCTIRRVVDGDTVDVDIDLGFDMWIHNERVRLYGIDTPESRTRDLEEKKAGIYAKQCVEAFLPVGSTQTLKTYKDKVGKYGRILGEFIIFDDTEIKFDKGDVLVFPSLFLYPHKVEPVKSGTRYSYISWVW